MLYMAVYFPGEPRGWRAGIPITSCTSQPALGATHTRGMAGLTVEDQCITITGPLLGEWKAELHNELESLTTALTFLSLPSTLPGQSSDMTDEQRAQHHGDRGIELYNGADYFHADANGLETNDDASRALPAGGGRSVCDADGGASQITQRAKDNPLDTSFAVQEWLRYRIDHR